MQKRAKTGTKFEQEQSVSGWFRKPVSPRLKWSGNGRNNFNKIINCNYNPKELLLLDCSLCKYDITNNDGEYREVKKYHTNNLKQWMLYSEPYFKVADRKQMKYIEVDKYNEFIDNFYQYNLLTGLFEKVITGMTECISGIQFIDKFTPKEEIEFRTIVVCGWGGYKRITIQFKLKTP
jgi:hypothetical protein